MGWNWGYWKDKYDKKIGNQGVFVKATSAQVSNVENAELVLVNAEDGFITQRRNEFEILTTRSSGWEAECVEVKKEFENLIAAAPELLQALKAIVGYVEFEKAYTAHARKEKAVMLKKIIAKAEGVS